MMASAPATVQCIPVRVSRVPMATLQPDSTKLTIAPTIPTMRVTAGESDPPCRPRA